MESHDNEKKKFGFHNFAKHRLRNHCDRLKKSNRLKYSRIHLHQLRYIKFNLKYIDTLYFGDRLTSKSRRDRIEKSCGRIPAARQSEVDVGELIYDRDRSFKLHLHGALNPNHGRRKNPPPFARKKMERKKISGRWREKIEVPRLAT